MKSMKFIFSSIFILAIMLFISMPNIYADSNTEENILEVIKSNDFLDIKKIEFDKNNKVIPSSVEDVNIDSKNTNLQNGTYLLKRGTGWVLGNDRSFIKSGFAGPNEVLRILDGKTVSYEHSVMNGVGAEFDFEYVKGAIEMTYEHSFSELENISTGFEIESKNKNIYAKTYTTFSRYDLVKVQNGRVTGHSVTYEPDGSWMKYISYNQGEYINQDALKERVDRCVLGEPQEINIKNSIKVQGSDHLKNMDILLDGKAIKLANRSKTKIHPETGSGKYFTIELLDSNNKVKASMSMNGNDFSADSKYDSFDNVPYNIGDKINIYHKQPYLLEINGTVSGTNNFGMYFLSYTITSDGLEYAKVKNHISVHGSDNIKNMDILLVDDVKRIRLANKSNTPIHPRTGSSWYFSMELLDSNNKTKAFMVMNGNDYSANSKYDDFDNVEYSIGDRIRIYHRESRDLLKVNGNIQGDNDIYANKREYIIRDNYLEVESIKTGINHIKPIQDTSLAIEMEGWTRNISLNTVVFSGNHTEWEFIYNAEKDAYAIRPYLLLQNYLGIKSNNTLGIVDNRNDDHALWKLNKVDDAYYITNLATGTSLDIENGNVSQYTKVVHSQYTGKASQKFKIQQIR